MKKNLGNGARKILDNANTKLANILNDDMPVRVRNRKKHKVQKVNDDYDEEMDEGMEGDKPIDEEGSARSKSQSNEDHDSSVNSNPYGDEEPEDEQEMIEAEIAR